MEPLHILLVEDEDAHVAAVKRAFAHSGSSAELTVIDSLQGYRRCVAEAPPDLAIMDLNLRDGRAVEVLTAPAEQGQFPILLMTSHGNEHLAVEAIKAGAIDYIVKSPDAFAQLPRIVESALREWRLLVGRKELEGQLRQSQKMEAVGRLAGGVAHDFNNMLNVITGYAELALQRVGTDEKMGGYLRSVLDAAHRSADLTRQLLAFSRKQVVEPRVLDLNQTLAAQLKLFEKLVGEDIQLDFAPGPEVGTILIDPSQLDQLLANLIVNAKDSIAGGGSISVSTATVTLDQQYCSAHPGSHPGAYIRLSVADSGCGMDAATIERIFEPFFTTKELGKGTGLGLATVYGIIKQNNGEIHCESRPGSGSTFVIHLPGLNAAATDGGVVTTPLTVICGTETILLVEDDPHNLEITRLLLEQSGYTVVASSSPAEACQLFEQHKAAIALLLSDVVMPQMNGSQLYTHIKAANPDVRALFMSGYTDDIITNRGILPNGVNFIHKPFTMTALSAKVRAVLDLVIQP